MFKQFETSVVSSGGCVTFSLVSVKDDALVPVLWNLVFFYDGVEQIRERRGVDD